MSNSKPIACFFGSFNPIHIGHLQIVEQLISDGYMVHLIVSPHNPHKKVEDLYPFDFRVDLCKTALYDYFLDNPNVLVNTIEEDLPKPNYTYLTLRKMKEQYGDIVLVIGSDVLYKLYEWKNYDEIKQYPIIEVERSESSYNFIYDHNINFNVLKEVNIIKRIDPLNFISSTIVRELLDEDIKFLEENNFVTKNTLIKLKHLVI